MKTQIPQKQVTKISVLSFNNGERYSYTAPAYLMKNATGFRLLYSEPGMQGIETALTLDDGRLFLSRSDGTRLVFEENAETVGVYCMLNGTLTADIATSVLSLKQKEKETVEVV